MSAGYREYIVESFRQLGESSRRKIRVRPVPGQGLRPDLRVRCRTDIREQYPVGTRFRVRAKLAIHRDGCEFLYVPATYMFQPVDDEKRK
jgi:hypothetical protein